MKKVKCKIWYPTILRHQDEIMIEVPDDIDLSDKFDIENYLSEKTEEILEKEGADCYGLDSAIDVGYAGVKRIPCDRIGGCMIEMGVSWNCKCGEIDQEKFKRKKDYERQERISKLVAGAEKENQCCCDLDNYQPDPETGHSWVCIIHKLVIAEI